MTGGPVRLALLGDVHANLPALRAVLAAIDAAGIAEGVVTGDLVMRGTEPGECIDAVRARGWPTARGNTDHKVALKPRDPHHPKARRPGSRAWTVLRLRDDQIAFLAGLPLVSLRAVGGLHVAVMHGGPDDPREVIGRDTPASRVAAVARLLRADVLVNGHTHDPLVRRVGDVLLVNPGSVGEGVPGDRRPRWAWLELGADGLDVHLARVEAPLAHLRT